MNSGSNSTDSLHIAFYNFCRVHETTRTTRAQTLGLTDRSWTIGELIDAALGTQPITPVTNASDLRTIACAIGSFEIKRICCTTRAGWCDPEGEKLAVFLQRKMVAIGTLRRFCHVRRMVAFGGKAEVTPDCGIGHS
jgi:hypothetical protein